MTRAAWHRPPAAPPRVCAHDEAGREHLSGFTLHVPGILGDGAMSRTNKQPLHERVARAAEAALADHDYVSALDVFLRIGWLDGGTAKRWQQGQLDCLEQALQTHPARISEAIQLLQSWASQNGLIPSEAAYVARTPGRPPLRFGKSGDPSVEQMYRTHFVSRELPEKKRERLAEKANRGPELVAILPRNRDWKCHRCANTGDILMMENEGPACLACVGLGDLEFLAAGNARLTRLAKAKSERHAVVVRFSKTRGRYERQGLLVETQALDEAQRELGIESLRGVGRAHSA